MTQATQQPKLTEEQKEELRRKAERRKHAQLIYGDQDGNDIDSILKQELEDLGLEYRFIDYKQAKINGGMSRAGWKVYHRISEDTGVQGINTMTDADGLVRQGSLVLAVKTKKSAERKREMIRKQNEQLNRYNKNVTDEVSADAAKLGGSSRAIAGYDKNS